MEEDEDKKNVENEEKVEYISEEREKSSNFERKIKKLKEKLRSCQKEKEEYLAGWQKERADFINYKKDEEERLKEKELFQKEKIVLEILLTLDNIKRAEKELPEEIKENQWVKGVLEIKSQVKNLLKKEGVEEIKSEEKFNPEFHEAVEVIEGEDNKIIEVLQDGYLFKGKVLRPAMVKVGKSKNLKN